MSIRIRIYAYRAAANCGGCRKGEGYICGWYVGDEAAKGGWREAA